MSLKSGASGSSARGPNTILVDLDFSILELSGLLETDKCMYQCKWKRGHRHQGETQWMRAESGKVKWKQSFHLPQQVMPMNMADASKKKFLDIQLHRQAGPNGVDSTHRNLRVELSYQGEKRRKAKISVPFETPDGRPTDFDLQISVQMRESTGFNDTASLTAGSVSSRGRGREATPSEGSLKRTPSLSAINRNALDNEPPSAAMDPELQNIYAGVQSGAPGASADNMKMNVLKLFSKIQEQEGLIGEKRRECKEIRNAYGNLRSDYDHLRTDLENAEMRCNRLKQELRREQERNRDLMEMKQRYELHSRQQPGPGEERRTCETGNCCMM